MPVERPFVPQLKMYWLLVVSYLNKFPVVAALVDVASAYVPSTLPLYFTIDIVTVAVLSGVTPSFWNSCSFTGTVLFSLKMLLPSALIG